MAKVRRRKVDLLFEQRVNCQPNLNSVLDASDSKNAHKTNLLHDYYSKRYVKRFVDPVKDDLILDFGCGVGRLSEYLSPYSKKIIGVDSIKRMIEIAKGKGERPNLEYFTIEKLNDFTPDTFSKIFSNWVLAHLEDEELEQISYKFFKLLKPLGKLIFFEQVVGNEEKEEESYKRRYSNEYIQVFRSAGFHFIKSEKVYRYPSYSRTLINRFKIPVKPILPVLYLIERMTVNRKPETAQYYTEAFVFEKPKATETV